MIADLADAERTRFVITPGQSGHFLSPYYGDQLPLWRDGHYLSAERSSSEPVDGTLLVLTPALTHS